MKRRVQCILTFILGMFVIPLIQTDEGFSSSVRDEMIAKAKKEGALVIAGSRAEDIKTRLPGFQKRYPFIKIKDLDMNTKAVVNRVSLEAKVGRLGIGVELYEDDLVRGAGGPAVELEGENLVLGFGHIVAAEVHLLSVRVVPADDVGCRVV